MRVPFLVFEGVGEEESGEEGLAEMRFNIALRQLEEQPSGIAETACHMCGVWILKKRAPYIPLTENYFVRRT